MNKNIKEVHSSSGPWKWLYRQLRPFLRSQLAGLACLVSASALSLCDPLIFRWLIDNGLKAGQTKPALAFVGLLLISSLTRLMLLGSSNLIASSVLQRLVLHLRSRLVQKLHSMPASFFDGRQVGDLIVRIEQDVDQVAQLATEAVGTVLRMMLITVFVLGAMFFLDWRLGSLGVIALPFFLLMRWRFRGALETASNIARAASGNRSSFLTESVTGAMQIQLLGAERTVLLRYVRLAISSLRASLSQRKIELAYTLGSLSLISLVTACVLGLGVLEVARGALTAGGFVAFYSYLNWLFEPLGTALDMYARFQRAGASIRRIREIENEPAEEVVFVPVLTRPRSLRCENLAFAYPGGESALSSVDVELREGEKVALIGRSGSGKSTLAKLLMRLYNPHDGTIQVDGVSIKDLNRAGVRRSIACVPQDPVLFRGTLRENLRLGGRWASEDELDRASYVACFDEVLAKLPGGWDHVLGTFGAGLSGGEKQRLAVARALLQDRPVLILDEATSGLDPALEEQLLSRLKEHAKDKTVLLISHRSSAARWADRVVVLDRGRIVGQPVVE